MIKENGIEKTVEKISGVDIESDFGKKIIDSYYDIREKRKDWKK